MNQNDYHNFLLYEKDMNQALKKLFRGKINGSFLINIKSNVKQMLGQDLFTYYNFSITNEKIVAAEADSVDYDICNHIVGIHRTNMIFLSKEERLRLENDDSYKRELANKVVSHIKLRKYGSVYFRKRPLLMGDNFIYFSLPYDLFVMCMKIHEMLKQNSDRDQKLRADYRFFTNKALAALCLLEDNFVDSAYPVCRTLVEMYMKFCLIWSDNNLIEKYRQFANFEIEQSCCSQRYSVEFNELFENRLAQSSKNKKDYLHYGWVDYVADYHNIVKNKPYTINGLFNYVKHFTEGNFLMDVLQSLYKMCHGYAHGNVHPSLYILLHYFEVSIMLYVTISGVYGKICDELNVKGDINGIDIITEAEHDFEQLFKQDSEKSEENFELYYDGFSDNNLIR